MRAPEPGEFEYFTNETLTITNAAAGLFPNKAAQSMMARIDVETAEIRYWLDGGAPTAATGILAGPGSTIYVYATEVTRFRAVRTAGINAVLQVSYGKWPAGRRGSFNG